MDYTHKAPLLSKRRPRSDFASLSMILLNHKAHNGELFSDHIHPGSMPLTGSSFVFLRITFFRCGVPRRVGARLREKSVRAGSHDHTHTCGSVNLACS